MEAESKANGQGDSANSSLNTDLFRGDSLGDTNADDLFSSLASKHSITTTDQVAMEFDPFGDSPWGSSMTTGLGSDDPFDTSSVLFTKTTTTTSKISESDVLSNTNAANTNVDFDDLLNFDPLSSTKSAVTKFSDSGNQSLVKSPEVSHSLFSDLDPFSSLNSFTPADKTQTSGVGELSETKNTRSIGSDPGDLFDVTPLRSDTVKVRLCEPEDDPFEIKSPPKYDQKPVKMDIYESMKADSSDPFSTDPFISLDTPGEITSATQDSAPTQEKKPDAAAWLDSFTFTKDVSLAMADPGVPEVTEQGSEVKMEEDCPVIMRRDKEKEETTEVEESDKSLDLSAIEGTDHLDVGASKQKSSLGKKGSLALRRKPSRKGVRSSLLTVVDRYQDSTDSKDSSTVEKEASEEGSQGVQEKHDEEKPENVIKPKAVDRPSALPRGGSRAPPGGQILLPGLGDITKVKLRTSPVKPLSGRPSPEASKPQSSGLTQPLSIPKVQLRSSQRSSLILPKPEKTTTAAPNRASFNPFPSKPLLQTKPRLSEKPKLEEHKVPLVVRHDEKAWQPSWLREAKERKLEDGSGELGEKHQQDQEPEKPAWMKASIERRQKVATVSDKDMTNNINKENSLSTTSQPSDFNSKEKKSVNLIEECNDSENRLNELNYLHKKKSSEANPAANQEELIIESPLRKTSRSRLCVSDMSLNKPHDNVMSSNNGHMTDSLIMGSTTSMELNEAVVMRPKMTSKQDYVPSWSRESSNHVLPASVTAKDGENNSSSTELPKWKRDLLEKRRQKPAGSVQIAAAQDAPSNDSSNPPWQKELQNRRRSSLKFREPVAEPKQQTQPEWMRKAEERRARLAKSGLIDKK